MYNAIFYNPLSNSKNLKTDLHSSCFYLRICAFQMAGQIDMNRQSDLMAAFEEQCGK